MAISYGWRNSTTPSKIWFRGNPYLEINESAGNILQGLDRMFEFEDGVAHGRLLDRVYKENGFTQRRRLHPDARRAKAASPIGKKTSNAEST